MYAALWRVLPGPWWVRTLLIIFTLTVLLIACVMFIFPWVDQQFFAPADPVIDGGLTGDSSVPPEDTGGDGGLIVDDGGDSEGGLVG